MPGFTHQSVYPALCACSQLLKNSQESFLSAVLNISYQVDDTKKMVILCSFTFGSLLPSLKAVSWFDCWARGRSAFRTFPTNPSLSSRACVKVCKTQLPSFVLTNIDFRVAFVVLLGLLTPSLYKVASDGRLHFCHGI